MGYNMSFSAEFDKTTIVISLIVSIVLVYAGVDLFLRSFTCKTTFFKVIDLLSSLILFTAFIGGVSFSPYKYVLEENNIVIKSLLKSIKIPYNEIKYISDVNANEVLKNSLRIFGSGGFFGYYGKFSFNNETVYIYVRKKGKWVMIETKDRKYFIAPEHFESFIDELKSRINKK